MIKALVLDFDGLMLDTESALVSAYGDVHAAHGIAFDEADFLRCVGHVDYTFDPWRSFDAAADRGALETERRRLNNLRNDSLSLLPGVGDLLDAAAARGLKLAVASNSSHPHVDTQLRRLGIFSRFEIVACREDVASPKPEPDIYRFVLRHLGLRGSEAIAFEDSAAGSLAAKRAGLYVVAVPNRCTRHHDLAHADLQIPSLQGFVLDDLTRAL